MDVDEDEEGSQHAKRVPDYGIEVDFSALDDDEREVHKDQSQAYAVALI
jgi:structural maintenance of chromosome 1